MYSRKADSVAVSTGGGACIRRLRPGARAPREELATHLGCHCSKTAADADFEFENVALWEAAPCVAVRHTRQEGHGTALPRGACERWVASVLASVGEGPAHGRRHARVRRLAYSACTAPSAIFTRVYEPRLNAGNGTVRSAEQAAAAGTLLPSLPSPLAPHGPLELGSHSRQGSLL